MKIKRGWESTENGTFTRKFESVTFTVYANKRGEGWLYAGGNKRARRPYPTPFAAMEGAQGAATGGRRYYTPGASMKKIKQWARTMRRNMTPAEKALWVELQKLSPPWSSQRRTLGRIVDFYCPKGLLAVEADSPSHDRRKDRFRDNYLAHFGIMTLRFTNDRILSDLPGVMGEIEAVLLERLSQPLPESPGPRYVPIRRAREVKSPDVEPASAP